MSSKAGTKRKGLEDEEGKGEASKRARDEPEPAQQQGASMAHALRSQQRCAGQPRSAQSGAHWR